MGTFQLGVRVRKCPKLAKADPQLAAASLFVNSHQSGLRGRRARRDCAPVSIRGAFDQLCHRSLNWCKSSSGVSLTL